MKIRLILMLLVICTGLGFSGDSFVWNKNGQGTYEYDVQKLLVDPMNDAHIYAGTSKALYKSIDNGRNYRMILRLSGEPKGVNDIFIPSDDSEIVYAATDAGLYESLDGGKAWKRIYFSSDAKVQRCLSVIRYGDMIYLGTQKGLFYKRRREAQWNQVKEGLDDDPVYHIVQDGRFLYASTLQAVFRLEKKTRKLQKIFSLGIGKSFDTGNALDKISTGVRDQSIKFIEVLDFRPPHILVATTQGIYLSSDNGAGRDSLPTGNIALEDLTSLLVLGGEKGCRQSLSECLKLMAGTKKGVFFLNDGKWMPVYKGMETNEINSLAKDARGTVYAATNKGIFYLPVKEGPSSFNKVQGEQMTTIQEFQIDPGDRQTFDHEPSINEVHQMAIDYAEVSHEKIK
ncbi:MAG: hypothetical protein KAR32_02710, partial [Candidatus Omnitrophica bacterium]|nr:hypothetical protein [Candidatus Omnitrophota bacterium]